MKGVAQVLRTSVARAFAVTCAAVFVITAPAAHANMNVWTSHGPPGGNVLALAIDPVTPSTLYAGTGAGVFKSTNGGATWAGANAGLTNPFVRALAIDPLTPSTLYAGSLGVFKSTDAGGIWANTGLGPGQNGFVVVLAVDPLTPSTLYAVIEYEDSGTIFKSTDAGETWGAAYTGPYSTYVLALAIDPITPSTLYAGTTGIIVNGILKSTDAGASWVAANVGLSDTFITALVIDPLVPNTLYVGTISHGVFKSTDAGTTWDATGLTATSRTVTSLVVDPSTPDTLYTATYGGGVFKSRDAGASWGELNAGLTNTNVHTLAIDPITPDTLYAGTFGGGVFSIQQIAADVVGTGTAASCTDAALNTALAGGGVVTFDCGPNPVTIDISEGTGTKTIAADTTIDGGGLITISGGNTIAPLFRVPSANFTVRNLTIAKGHSFHGPGSIDNDSGTLTVTNSTFAGNRADDGPGGGIRNDSGSVTVTDSTFTSNSASGGGGIYNASGTLTVTNSTFTSNRGGGGGIYNGGTAALTNCTLSGNSSTSIRGFGGGIYNSGTATLTNCTLSNNSARVGGGIYNYGTATLINSIVANSLTGGDCALGVGGGAIVDGGHNLSSDNTCFSSSELVNTDPRLAPLANYGGPTETLALCTAVGIPDPSCSGPSPAIGAGDQSVCAAPPVDSRDQRGVVRPGTGYTQCSIGAYEAEFICVGDCSTSGDVTIDELITLINIALGSAQSSACPHGIPSGAEVDVAFLVRAVNNALNGCSRDNCPTDGPTEFTDDFSSGNAADWSPATNGWTVVAGQYQGAGTELSACAGLGLNQSLVRNLCARDAEVELDMTSVGRVDKGVILRSTGPDNQIELNFRAARPDGFPADLIVQEVSDCRRTLLTPEFSVLIPPHDVGQRIHIRIRLVGNQLTVWIDGTQVLDGSFPFVNGSGQLGLAVIDGGLATFDNVSVRVLGR